MTAKDWDEGTNPGVPRTIAVVRRLADKANDHDITLRDLAGLIGKVMGGLQALDAKVDGLDAKVDGLDAKLSKRLDRIEDIARGAARSAEDSSSDLSQFKQEVRKMKLNGTTVALAVGLGALALAAGYFHIDQPWWLVGMEVAVGAGVASQFKPAFDTTPKPPTGGAS